MIDHADKSYLNAPLPDSHEARVLQIRERMGRKLATHRRSTLKYAPAENGSRVLTEWRNRQIRGAKA